MFSYLGISTRGPYAGIGISSRRRGGRSSHGFIKGLGSIVLAPAIAVGSVAYTAYLLARHGINREPQRFNENWNRF